MESERVVVWFSAGVTSAVAAALAIKKYMERLPIVLVNTNTGSEHEDNFRFMDDCANWLGQDIEILKNPDYGDTFDVYRRSKFLVSPYGARCSLVLKKQVRQKFERLDTDIQVFGFDATEVNRVNRFVENNPLVKMECPLIEAGLTKMDCHRYFSDIGISSPLTYNLGFKNANCLGDGRACVKGKMGYWNLVRKVKPHAFYEMADLERELDISIITRKAHGEVVKIFLDELSPLAGNYKTEPLTQCSLFCGPALD